MEKKRLDIILFERGYFESREKAKSAIMAGNVLVNNDKADKPGTYFNDDCEIRIIGNTNPYVSRGGLKLERALEEFQIDLKGKVIIDIGASTGGFTDCALKNGAEKSYAIDVGYGQLAWTLRQDPRVLTMERTNIRNVKTEDINEPADFVFIDVSFISIQKVIPIAANLLKENGQIISLVKPQFEAGRGEVGKNGVVRKESIHKEVVKRIIHFVATKGMTVINFCYSPIKGPKGNIEFFIQVQKCSCGNSQTISFQDVESIIEKAHKELYN